MKGNKSICSTLFHKKTTNYLICKSHRVPSEYVQKKYLIYNKHEKREQKQSYFILHVLERSDNKKRERKEHVESATVCPCDKLIQNIF
jgi:hypothetical protein